MEETIKGIEVIAYKGMNSDMTCRDFKYELGKSYKTDKAELCKWGFHACLNPRDVLGYYFQEGSRYFKVLLSGKITKCDSVNTKVAATEITILEEINIDECIKTTEWWKNDNVIDLLYFSDGLARVQRKDKWNFIDKQGKFLSEQWFIDAYSFNGGFARVQRVDGLWNFIDIKGKILSEKWFNCIGDFRDGFARVQRGDRLWNFIDKDGNYLSEKWFNCIGDFRDGFARVQRGDRLYNFINKKGKLLSEQWFNDVYCFHEGFARVQRVDGLWNFIDIKGKILSEKWFNCIGDFCNGFAIMRKTNGLLCKLYKNGIIV